MSTNTRLTSSLRTLSFRMTKQSYDLDLEKPKFVILRKPRAISLLAIIILIGLFVFGVVMFVVVKRISNSPNLDKNKEIISPRILNQFSSKQRKSLNLYTALTSHGNDLNENHQKEQASLFTNAFFDGVEETNDSSTTTSGDDLFTAFINNHASTAEPSLVPVLGTMPTEQAKGQFC